MLFTVKKDPPVQFDPAGIGFHDAGNAAQCNAFSGSRCAKETERLRNGIKINTSLKTAEFFSNVYGETHFSEPPLLILRFSK